MKLPGPKITIAGLKKNRWSLAACALTVLALAAAHFMLVGPILDQKEELESKIRQQKDLIKKYEQKLNQAQSIRDEFAKHEGDLKDMERKLFHGTDPYQLAATLGDLLSAKGRPEGQKLDIKTYQVLASQEHGLYQEVHLRFNLMTNIDGLHYFLARVRNSEFAILVQEINIQKIQRNKGPDLVINVILAALMEKS